jgi:hypothetical protein
MPVLSRALTTLSSVKLSAGIDLTDVSSDALLTKLINNVTVAAESYLGRSLALQELEEYYNGLGRQRLLLRSFPVQSIVSIYIDGALLAEGVDYFCRGEDKKNGFVFRSTGWPGSIVERGLTLDPISGNSNIKVTYNAGFLMPGQTGYVEGAENSLPLDLSMAADDWVVSKFNAIRQGGLGLKRLSEGGLTYEWDNGSSSTNNSHGLSQSLAGLLNNYKSVSVA